MSDGGGSPQSQSSFSNQSQQQQGHSSSQPNDYTQGMLKGITGAIYNQYTGMPGGNPVPDPSANTNAFWNQAAIQGTNGVAGLGATPTNYASDVLNGKYADLNSNPYFQSALDASNRASNLNFANNTIPVLQSTFAGAGRPGSGANQQQIQLAADSLGRNLTDANALAANSAYQFERGQQGATLGMLPSLNAAQIANIGLLGQAGQAQDAYNLQKNLGPLNYATQAGSAILGLYPGGSTDSNGWSTGSGSMYGTSTQPSNTTSSLLGGGLGLAGLGLQAYSAFSDRRDKTDIEELGVDPLTGFKTYAYRYKGDAKNTPKVVGPMAQDIEKVRPDLVREIGGHKVVHPAAMGSYVRAMPAGGLM